MVKVKICSKCKVSKNTNDFRKSSTNKGGFQNYCKVCANTYRKENGFNKSQSARRYKIMMSNPEMKSREYKLMREARIRNRINQLCRGAKARAKKNGLDYNLIPNEIIIPELCPLLEIPITISDSRLADDHSPSLDRIINHAGYTMDNVRVISLRANRMKNNASTRELILFGENIIKYLNNDI